MPTETQRRVYELLRRMPDEGLVVAKQLFWTELNYDHANASLSDRHWPERARDALIEAPVILAQHESQYGSFDVIYARLSPEQRGRDFPLSLTAERLVINQLLNNHPYALFVFSDPDQRHWHLVNVRLDKVPGTSKVPGASTRRVFRRISVGPHERLRTAAERAAMLDVASLSPDLFGLSPIAIQQRHDEAFDVEAVTREFFGRFARLFYRVRDDIATVPDLADQADTHAQMLLDRLLFLYFVQKKGWLDQAPDYLYDRFLDGHIDQPESASYYGDVIYPLFLALSDREANHNLAGTFGVVPFLNGGLFELHLTSGGLTADQARLPVSNGAFNALFEDLLEHYNFTISEDSPLDQEVAIDPEMLGKIFESLVLEREHDPDVDLRKATGSYYTPRPMVAFMCREALAEYLTAESGIERARIAALLDLPPAAQLTDDERHWLTGAFSPAEAQALKALLLKARTCDLAVGSGAFLVGLLQAITWTVELLDWRLGGDEALARRNYAYDLKKQVVEHCLYGVDIQAQAIQICKLRLWLSLVVDYELPGGIPFAEAIRQVPSLPNLAYKVRQGDSILERLFGGVVQLDELARDRETQEIVEVLQSEKAAYFRLSETPEKRHRELKILELQTALAEKLVEAKRERLLGYQPTLFGDETAKGRREREALEAHQQEVDELKTRVEQVRERVAKLCRQGDTRKLTADELRRQLLGDPEHPTFLWRVDFAEVFQEKGGFDVMIANPPYVRQEKIKHLKASLKQVYPDVYHGVADIYVYFYARGLRQLRDDGTLVYVSSNKFMRAGYGQTLRRLLGREVTLRTVIDFGDLPVFEATTYPTVLVMRKQAPARNHMLQALTVDDIAVVDRLAETVKGEAWPQPQASLRPEGWTLVRPQVRALLEKLRRSGMPLEEYTGNRFYRGVTTGLNQAFAIDQATRDKLIAEDPRSAEIIKPWVRGRDIDRWSVNWSSEFLLWMYKGIPVEKYPVVLEHLSRFREKLVRRWEPRHGQCEWYELRPCDYYAEFEKPKMIWAKYGIEPAFAHDVHNYFCGNTVFILPTTDLVLVGILNSKALQWFATHTFNLVQGGYIEWIPTNVAKLPIPQVTPAQRAAIEDLVRKLLDARGEGPQVAEWERELNALVYQMYGLRDEEIAIVEGQR